MIETSYFPEGQLVRHAVSFRKNPGKIEEQAEQFEKELQSVHPVGQDSQILEEVFGYFPLGQTVTQVKPDR